MAKYLLDTNVLLALAWPSHEFHETAHRWWTHSRKRWATCALTELTVRGVKKTGQKCRAFQVQTTGRFEVEDFAKHIQNAGLNPLAFAGRPLRGINHCQ